MNERDRISRRAAMRELEREEKELFERLERPLILKRLESELNQNTQKLMQLKRQQALGIEEQPYISEQVKNLSFSSEEELAAFNRAETKAFRDATAEWHPTSNNVSTLIAYYTNRGINVIDRTMLKSAYLLLKKSGLLDEPEPEPTPAPVAAPVAEAQEENFDNIPRLPLDFRSPVAWKRDTQEIHKGIDLTTGQPREYTQFEVDRMSAEEFARCFVVRKGLALTKVNFGQR